MFYFLIEALKNLFLYLTESWPQTSFHQTDSRERIQERERNFSYRSIYPSSPSLIIGKFRKKVLVLDLDETLVHSTTRMKPPAGQYISSSPNEGNNGSYYDFQVEVFVDGISRMFYVSKRPHVNYFLDKVSQWYDIVIFTASIRQYANPLINQLDPNRNTKQRLYRDSCVEQNGVYIKNLTRLGMDLTQTIIIDNSPIAYSHNEENAIPIEHWYGNNSNDEALLNLLPFLNTLRFVEDVRSILSLRHNPFIS